MFDRKKPCSNCPFRKGKGEAFELGKDRIMEIINASAFQCHKTVDYSGDEGESGNRPQQCAGLMALLHRMDRPNQIMQVAERLGALNPADLDPENQAYGSLDEVLAAHSQFAAADK